MKKKIARHNLLKMVIIIMLISVVTTISYAIYKSQFSGSMQATGAMVVLDVQQLKQTQNIIDEQSPKSELEFSVNNYITENEKTKLNQTVVEYYIKISGLENISSVLYKVYYIDKDNNEIELLKETKGNFVGYYKAKKMMGVTSNESDRYKIVIDLVGENLKEVNVPITVDAGYKQYVVVDKPIINTPIANTPKLVDGMIPVIWNETTNKWVTISKENENWYNYENKNWANIVTVKEENKSKYIGVSEGTTVETSDITTMYVWIPRFVYKINPNYYHQKVTTSQMATATDELVDIHFSKTQAEGGDFWDESIEVNNDTTSDAANGKWTTCPAFTFGNIELDGIWAMKFEASNSINNIYSVPSKTTLSTITLSAIYTAAREMETKTIYGMKTASTLQEDGTFATDSNGYDIHLIKNSEWSAIALFAQSKYGVGNGTIKPEQLEYAGGSATDTVVFTTNVEMSTTGTAYGLYDMSGNKWEYVAAYLGDGATAQSKVKVLYNALPRYKDIYHIATTNYNSQLSVYNMFENFKCATIWETSSTGVSSYDCWFEGRTNMGSGTVNLFLTRGASGGGANQVVTSAFAFGYGDGGTNSTRGFRCILAVDENL